MLEQVHDVIMHTSIRYTQAVMSKSHSKLAYNIVIDTGASKTTISPDITDDI